MKKKILSDFNLNYQKFENFRAKLEIIITDLLQVNQIEVHQVIGRVKDRDSLERKIDLKNKYTDLHQITDLVGLRIITHLESDVDKVAEIIKKSFLIDSENSVDKRNLKSDQFGYRSLHYVLSLDKFRSALPEYAPFISIKAEIQIRSTLQHAWAQIEHDLGYKGKATIPDEYIRSFNRLAALLETADKEFDRLKQSLTEYEKNIAGLIAATPQEVGLNQASVISLAQSNDTIKEALKIIQGNTKAEIFEIDSYEHVIKKFKEFFKITTVKDLQDSLKRDHKEFLRFADYFSQDVTAKKLASFVPLFYYQHYLSAKSEDVIEVVKYIAFPNEVDVDFTETALRLILFYRKAKSQADAGSRRLN